MIAETTPRGYKAIKALAKEVGRNVPDMLALARQNDPFYCGGETDRKKAEWFADLWRRSGYEKAHLRRLHYWMISQKDPKQHDGAAYLNTESCWNYLGDASKAARYLGLVEADDIEDHRNPAPHRFAPEDETPDESEWGIDPDDGVYQLPRIDSRLADQIRFTIPDPIVTGYDYSEADQPYHLEVWIEKSTMDDVLLPVCAELRANLVTSVGFQSITAVVSLLKRVHARGKPARVVYISDFDPAGCGMPLAVARQAEFWLEKYAPEADIRLECLALTRQQVERYQLPRIPLRDSDRRKDGFEAIHGEGVTELDALEATHPGELARIVRQAIQPYRDTTLRRRMHAAEHMAEQAVSDAWAEGMRPHRRELDQIQDHAAEIAGRYEARLVELGRQLQADLAPVRERLEQVKQAITEAGEQIVVRLPVRPESDIEPPEDDRTWLLDTQRDYLEQLEAYRRHKRGGTDE